ncbi:MAG: zinc-binding dehydrogenase, partial [Dehalococcoidia bacterium]|nr:zinc-binding dehydrogenase [Dehalococcoidia bacterium]
KISDDVPAEAAVLAKAVIGNGIQWLRVMGEAKIGDTVVIQGTGPQGLSATIAARESGAGNIIVTGLTRDAQRLALAREYGANHTVNVEEEDVVKFVRELTGGKMADVILDVTGNTRGMVTSVDLVKKQGIVVCAGTGTKSPTPLMMDKIVLNEIRLQGVFSSDSKVTPAAVKLIESRKYPIEKMVTHKFTLHQADEAVRAVAGEIEGMYPIKAVLVP